MNGSYRVHDAGWARFLHSGQAGGSKPEEDAMSKTKSNVHPGQYKVAGRERQGEEVVHEREKRKLPRKRGKRLPP